MLADTQKNSIQNAYRFFLKENLLKPRVGQKIMIAQIAKSLANIEHNNNEQKTSNNTTVIEAGTGTGKTLSYLIPSIVMSQALNKHLIISTATISLQEQLINKDLPELLKYTELQFSYILAKGRNRYVCLYKLDAIVNNDSAFTTLEIFPKNKKNSQEYSTHIPLYQKLLQLLSLSEWQGSKDDCPEEINEQAWQIITTDHMQCSGHRCNYFHQCPFFNARKGVEKSDIIIANHDLILADIAHGSGTTFPEIKNTIYVFDEAHHLPNKAIKQFTFCDPIYTSLRWFESIIKYFKKLSINFELKGDQKKYKKIPENITNIKNIIQQIKSILIYDLSWNKNIDLLKNTQNYRFKFGNIPNDIKELTKSLLFDLNNLYIQIQSLSETLKLKITRTNQGTHEKHEKLFTILTSLMKKLNSQICLWTSYISEESDDLPLARWITRRPDFSEAGEEIEVCSSPIMANKILKEQVWNKCYAAILTSATLTAMGTFDRFITNTGISNNATLLKVPSPFNYKDAATMNIPPFKHTPKDRENHTKEVIEILPKFLQEKKNTLVLFSSKSQMENVYNNIEKKWKLSILIQGNSSKEILLKHHKKSIDNNNFSIIFGLASLAEGIDLPGNYCQQVIIAKIPFSVPNNPIEEALSEWIETQGQNSFYEISVPDAIIKLKQACGRLLRNEHDTGKIIILDTRLTKTSYGRMILKSLPNFNLVESN